MEKLVSGKAHNFISELNEGGPGCFQGRLCYSASVLRLAWEFNWIVYDKITYNKMDAQLKTAFVSPILNSL